MYTTTFTLIGGLLGGIQGSRYTHKYKSEVNVTYGNIFFVKYGYFVGGITAGCIAGNIVGRLWTRL